ncbi:MAG: hypothetical protein IPJ60_02595 [Sphingobacteriaceae bacterium]|nr:hypothetical protein [Sphingobacteriaceae bacterium]
MARGKMLIVADYCRADFVNYFTGIESEFDLYFFYYNYKEEIKKDIQLKFGHIEFYHSYTNAFEILKKINPIKVLFFDIETYNQIALLAACKEKNIKTYHVEHGFRDYDIAFSTEQRNEYTRIDAGVKQKRIPFLKKIKNRLFYSSTQSRSKYKNELLQFRKFRSVNSIFNSATYLGKLDLYPDEFISFSPQLFNYHKRAMGLTARTKCHYTGFMSSDAYCKPIEFVKNKNIIFIDTFNHITQLWGITNEFVTSYYQQIDAICKKYKYDLYVKKHPADNTNAIENSKVKIISQAEFEKDQSKFCIIAGDYSTLYLELLGLPYTLGISFNTFPDKSSDPLKFLLKYNVTCRVDELKDLDALLATGDKFYDNYESLRKIKKIMFQIFFIN